MIFEALQSELVRLDYHLLRSKLQKIPEFNLSIIQTFWFSFSHGGEKGFAIEFQLAKPNRNFKFMPNSSSKSTLFKYSGENYGLRNFHLSDMNDFVLIGSSGYFTTQRTIWGTQV